MKRLSTWATGAVRYQGPVGVCQRREYGAIATWRHWQRGTQKYEAYPPHPPWAHMHMVVKVTHRVRTLRLFFYSWTRRMTSGTFGERHQWSGIPTIWSMYATENPMGLVTCLGASWPSWQEPIGK